MKRVIVIFEVPALVLNDIRVNGELVTSEGVTIYPIKADTDLKTTLLDLCVRESIRQEIQDGKFAAKANS